MSPLIKICGIRDPDTSYFAAQQGADFIGMVHYTDSKRHVTVEGIKEIISAAREGGAKAVLVVVDISQQSLDALLAQIEPDFIQLYCSDIVIPSHVGKIYANHMPKEICMETDYMLIDHPVGGQGIPLDWNKVRAPSTPRWFLAGGLNSENVSEAINQLRPMGVDVSSGVETDRRKDLDKITKFIQRVKSHG